VRPAGPTTAALAALLCPERASRLAHRAPAPVAAEVARLAALPAEGRLEALAAALGPPEAEGPGVPPRDGREGWPDPARAPSKVSRRLSLQERHGSPAAARTLPPAADAVEGTASGECAEADGARSMKGSGAMLPFDLPPLAAALVEVGPAARALGLRAAEAAGAALGELMGVEVRVRGRLLSGVPRLAATVGVAIELPSLPAHAVLAVDCGLVVALAQRLAGTGGPRVPATSITHAEQAVLELLVLGALDGLATLAEVADGLAPRLGLRPERVDRPVPVEITVLAGGARGRAVLLLPARAVGVAERPPELPSRLESIEVTASLRSGASRAPPQEVASARPGDVVPLDEPPGDAAALALPGGAAIRGRIEGDSLRVEELDMSRIGSAAAGLPVSLEVDLGSVAVPLRELARLEPGGVLPLPIDRRGLVTLRMGDRPLARGELVDLDGSVGVRIVAVEAAP
jgi:type III secretion protein Q